MARLESAELTFEFDDLVTAVYHKIKDLILNQQFTPGQKIKQEELARALGVSRTPIIKALHLLIGDNLVVYTPRRGFSVKALTTREMAEIFYIRELLDGAAARETALKATPDQVAELAACFSGYGRNWDRATRDRYMAADKAFHARLYEIAGIPMLSRINEMFNISRVSYQRGLIRDPQETLVEHLAIVDAFKNHDGELAERLARAHTIRSRAALLKLAEREEGGG